MRLGRRLVLLNRTYSASGRVPGTGATTYREQLRCPAERTQGVLTISMVNEHGQLFEDAIAVSFNSDFEQVLKYVALVPFLCTIAAVAVAARSAREGALLGI